MQAESGILWDGVGFAWQERRPKGKRVHWEATQAGKRDVQICLDYKHLRIFENCPNLVGSGNAVVFCSFRRFPPFSAFLPFFPVFCAVAGPDIPEIEN
jgi:hypothetical protein